MYQFLNQLKDAMFNRVANLLSDLDRLPNFSVKFICMQDSINKRRLSFVYAFRGLRGMVREEPNFLIHLLIATMVILAGIILDIEPVDWVLLAIVIGMVLAAEIFNSALENLSDMVTTEYHPLLEKVKDRSAGAVVVAAIAAAITGLLVFIPHFFGG